MKNALPPHTRLPTSSVSLGSSAMSHSHRGARLPMREKGLEHLLAGLSSILFLVLLMFVSRDIRSSKTSAVVPSGLPTVRWRFDRGKRAGRRGFNSRCDVGSSGDVLGLRGTGLSMHMLKHVSGIGQYRTFASKRGCSLDCIFGSCCGCRCSRTFASNTFYISLSPQLRCRLL